MTYNARTLIFYTCIIINRDLFASSYFGEDGGPPSPVFTYPRNIEGAGVSFIPDPSHAARSPPIPQRPIINEPLGRPHRVIGPRFVHPQSSLLSPTRLRPHRRAVWRRQRELLVHPPRAVMNMWRTGRRYRPSGSEVNTRSFRNVIYSRQHAKQGGILSKYM